MFWTETQTGQISSTEGLIGSEREGLIEFQGDQYGCEQFGKRNCGRNCGRGHRKPEESR